jgi:hypothetical protein
MSSSLDYLARIEIGTHTFTAEHRNVQRLVVRGHVSPPEASRMRSAMFEYGDLYRADDIVVDVTAMSGMDSGSREEFVHIDRSYPFQRCYIVGAPFALRTVILGLHRAGRIIRPEFFRWSMIPVATDADARRLINESRG